MGTLEIRLGAAPAPVQCEVLDSELELQFSGVVHGSSEHDLAPGPYLVRARLPSGAMVSRQVVVPPTGTVVAELPIAPSEHEWLSYQQFLGNVAPPDPTVLGGFPEDAQSQLTLWLRLWERGPDGWRPQPSPPQITNADPFLSVYSLTLYPSTSRLTALQVGGAQVPARIVLLPPGPEGAEVLLRPARVFTERNGGVALKAASRDQQAETLLTYLSSGGVSSAEALGEQMLAQAEAMLRGKLANPVGAAVAGYYLLRAEAYRQLHSWPANFAEWVDWLPDSAVIHAWQLLRQPGRRDLTTARQRLLQAEARGVPIYSIGVRYLIDGLARFSETARKADGPDEEVEGALARVRAYGAALDWNELPSSFYGADPASPSLDLQLFLPADDGSLAYLPDQETVRSAYSAPISG